MIDVVGLIAGVVVAIVWWSRAKGPRFPQAVRDPPKIDHTNKVARERMPGPHQRIEAAKAKAARRAK